MRNPLSGGRAVGKPQSRTFMLALGALGMVAALGMLWIGFNAAKTIPGRSYFYLNAEFVEADNLSKTYQVRQGAKLIGQVQELNARNGLAVIRLQLNGDERGKLRTDARLEVRPRSPVGVRYIDVKPGTKGRPLREDETIKATNTSATTPLESGLRTFDPVTREGFKTALSELGASFYGRGEDISSTLKQTPEVLQDTDTVVTAVTNLDGAVGRFIKSTQGAANAADPVRNRIATGWNPESRALRPFSQEADAVRTTFDEAPPTLRTARLQLRRTDPFLRATSSFLRTAQPTLRVAPDSLRETTALLRESQSSLRNLDRTFQLAEAATPPTLDVLDTADPVLPDVSEVSKDGQDLADDLAPRGCDVDRFARNWESMMTYSDGEQAVLRLNVVFGLETIEGGTSMGGLLPPTPFRDNPYPAPCEAKDIAPQVFGDGPLARFTEP